MVKSIDGVMVSDEAEHKIYVFNTDGMLGTEVGGKGSGTESLQSPTDLASKNGLKILLQTKRMAASKFWIMNYTIYPVWTLVERAQSTVWIRSPEFGDYWKPEKLCLLSSGYLQVWDSLGKGIHRFNSKGDYLGFSPLTQAIGKLLTCSVEPIILSYTVLKVIKLLV